MPKKRDVLSEPSTSYLPSPQSLQPQLRPTSAAKTQARGLGERIGVRNTSRSRSSQDGDNGDSNGGGGSSSSSSSRGSISSNSTNNHIRIEIEPKDQGQSQAQPAQTKPEPAEPAGKTQHTTQTTQPSNTPNPRRPSQTATQSTAEILFTPLNRPALSRLQEGMAIDQALVPSQRDCVRALRKYTTLTNAEIFRRVGISTSNGYRSLRVRALNGNINGNNGEQRDEALTGERGDEDEEEGGGRGGEDNNSQATTTARRQPPIQTPPLRGRKRKLDQDVVDRVIREIDQQPAGEKTRSWTDLCRGTGAEVTPITLKRAVENVGYYKCPACQRVSKMHGLGQVKD